MDRTAALLVALRAAAGLGDGRLEPARVEVLAEALGIAREELPSLIARLHKSGHVAIAWGGILEVVPEAATSTGTVINNQGVSFGPGAVIAGRDATGGTISITPESAFGVLAAVLTRLQEVRPGLQGQAAEAADSATEVLGTPPATEASSETRHAWARRAGAWLGRLLQVAPEVKDAVELGEQALNTLGWGN